MEYEIRVYNGIGSLVLEHNTNSSKEALCIAYVQILQNRHSDWVAHINPVGRHGLYVARLSDIHTFGLDYLETVLRKKFKQS